jgi:hypothetical protein
VESCLAFGETVYEHLLPLPNRPEFFGRQVVMNAQDEETGEEMEVEHTVSLRYAKLTGKATVTIDGMAFTLTHTKGTTQTFRLGDMAAMLDFPKWGDPDVVVDGICVGSGKPYGG